MNSILNVNTEYIRPSRTIETVLVSNDSGGSVCVFVYNYEGISFRLFKRHLNLINFFNNKKEEDYHFDTEEELDEFLGELVIE